MLRAKTMQVDDFHATGTHVNRTELEDRIKSIRHGKYGAFIIYKSDYGPQLFINVNSDLAYIHYFDDSSGANAGYQPDRSGQSDMPRMTIDFIQVDKDVANGFSMPMQCIVPLSDAIAAALEFFDVYKRPSCINWLQL